MVKTNKFEHVIQEKWCKGCEICVALCPKSVLALSGGKAIAEKPGDCIGCLLCEMRCPDFAIEVHGIEKNNSGSDLKEKFFSVPPEVEA
ncbi:MAG: 4Fe-4S dicluster domain-containing protein [Treponema sp.]|nr:4Fe-4S dicluster domain-containing protein [Treponema sp.]